MGAAISPAWALLVAEPQGSVASGCPSACTGSAHSSFPDSCEVCVVEMAFFQVTGCGGEAVMGSCRAAGWGMRLCHSWRVCAWEPAGLHKGRQGGGCILPGRG